MPNTTVFTNNQYYQDIAAAIRAKNGLTTSYKPSEMATAIMQLAGGTISLQNRTVNPSTSVQTLTASSGYAGLGTVTINAIQTETKTVTQNGDVTPTSGKYLTKVTVNVPIGATINNQNVTIIPTESEQTITASSGYTGLGTVTIEAIDNTYIGSAITTRSSADLSASGATVNVPAGYYGSAASKAVTTTTQATPVISIDANGKIVATVTQGTGYVTGGTKSANQQMTTKSATTITPTNAIQTAVAKDVYTTGVISIAAVPTETVTLTSNGTHNATSGKFWSSVTVSVPSGINNQNKTVTSSTATQTVSADSGYSGLGVVTINAIATAAQATPVATIANATGIISATATQAAGYVSAGTKTGTAQLTTQAGKTVTPTATTQTAVASYRWTTGTITVAAVPTDTNNTFTTNGTYTPASGKWFAEVEVNVPSGVNNEAAKTVTPSTATQTISPSSGYSGLSKVTVNPIPSNYITTSDATATASEILNTKTAYVNGSKVTGTMTNRGAVTYTITTQGGSYTISAGYHNGSGKVTASLPVSTITNGVLNVATITESTNDYGVEASITIPAGYYNTTTLSRVLSNILPAPTTAAAVGQILSGYQAYDYQGKLLSGTMTNRAAWNATLNDTITSTTIPAGYHNGSGTVSHATVNIPDPTISLDATTGVITASGSWTKGFTTDNSYSKTYSLTAQSATTATPTSSEQTIVTAGKFLTGDIKVAAVSSTFVGSGITTRTTLGVSGATVTASAGYYPNAVTATVGAMTVPTSTSASGSGTRKITVTPSTVSQFINLPTGYNSATAYFQINAMTNGTAKAPATISGSSATVSVGTNILTFSKSISVTPEVTAGYISAGTATNVTVTLSAAVTTKAAATYTPGTANQTIAAGTYLTGTQTIAGDADLTAGNIKAGVNIFNVNGTFTSDASASDADIVSGETAYVNGEKVTGVLVINRYYTGANAPTATLGNNGDIYFQA